MKQTPTHWSVPPPVHYLSLYGYLRGAQSLPGEGPYHLGGPESGHRKPSEPVEPTGVGFIGVGISSSWGGGMGVVIGGGDFGGGGYVANVGVHLKAAGYHCGSYR